MTLDFFVKKYQSSTVILFVGVNYSVRDLLCDVNTYALPAKSRYASHTLNDVRAYLSKL